MSNRPVVVQNECHPYLPAREVRSICKENEIVFQVYIMSHILLHLFSHVRLNPFSGIISCEQAYASLGAGLLPLLEDSTITSIATRLAVTPGQVTWKHEDVEVVNFCRCCCAGACSRALLSCPSLRRQSDKNRILRFSKNAEQLSASFLFALSDFLGVALLPFPWGHVSHRRAG